MCLNLYIHNHKKETWKNKKLDISAHVDIIDNEYLLRYYTELHDDTDFTSNTIDDLMLQVSKYLERIDDV